MNLIIPITLIKLNNLDKKFYCENVGQVLAQYLTYIFTIKKSDVIDYEKCRSKLMQCKNKHSLVLFIKLLERSEIYFPSFSFK